MESRVALAREKHKSGYSCSQAVACTYCDLVGISEETMFRVSEGFSVGMGGMKGVCGAVAAACMIAGAKNSTCQMGGPGSKAATNKYTKEIVQRFIDESGTVICCELKGIGTGTPVKPCPQCVKDAARILEEVVFSQE